jgi:CRP-like cAMP-binding protein
VVEPFIKKLLYGAALSDDHQQALLGAIERVTTIGARHDIIQEGSAPRDVHLVVEGFACRYKIVADGSRQIMAFLVPGDMCDIHVAILGAMDHGIGAVSECRIGHVSPKTVESLMREPTISRALWWASLVDEATLREWLVNMGRRETPQQMAHLFCELLLRMQSVGLADETSFNFPVSQEVLADALGVTTIHANRVLQDLRAQDLVVWERHKMTIPHVDRLWTFSGFDPAYLHLGTTEALARLRTAT